MDISGDVIKGRMRLLVHNADGDVVEERRADNIVVRGGAEIVANRFAGVADSEPINCIQVGFGREVADAEVTSLTLPEADAAEPPITLDDLRTALTSDQFDIQTDQDGVIRVSIAAAFSPSRDLEDVTEAGLLAGERLYNQVVFEPVNLRQDQDITFFWQIDFPFGH